MKKIPAFLFVLVLFSSFVNKEKDFTDEEKKNANTAEYAIYMTSSEREVIYYINLCRINPKKFLLNYLDHGHYIRKHRKMLHQKPEYLSSLKATLDTLRSLPPIQADKAMFELAECFAKEQELNGKTGHDRETCGEQDLGGECLAYGSSTAEDVVLDLLIDFDVEGRGHRGLLLDKCTGMGVSMKSHKTYRHMTVLDFRW